MSENEKSKLMIDEVFALYLYKVSLKVNEEYYKKLLILVILFRECINEIGWKIKI
jgi:hypothetical protein